MNPVFISVATADSGFAQQVKGHLEKEGIESWFWADPERRGGRFIPKIQQAINDASAFIAILSPDYVASYWCQLEWELAMQRDKVLQDAGSGSFIHVIVARSLAPSSKTSFFRNFDAIDFDSADLVQQISAMCSRISAAQPRPTEKGTRVIPTGNSTNILQSFRNRHDELDELLGQLNISGGQHFFVVHAGPKMGKTWFLHELNSQLITQSPQWEVRYLDLRYPPLDLRSNIASLISHLFQPVTVEQNLDDTIRGIAVALSNTERPVLCLLDSAELLADQVAESLKVCLKSIEKRLMASGANGVRFAFVVATRFVNDWLRAKGVRFKRLPLTHFESSVIMPALEAVTKDAKHTLSPKELDETTTMLFEETQGLPALLVRYMEWMREVGFVDVERMKLTEFFAKLAHPYIQKDLLSADNLLPYAGLNIEQDRDILEGIVLALSGYRLYTGSHIKYALDQDSVLKERVEHAYWTATTLDNAIQKTHLVKPHQELWDEFYVAIRRLLFRYRYPDKSDQISAHQRMIAFYADHWEGLDLKTRLRFFVERLWHQAEYIRLGGAGDATSLLVFARDLLLTGDYSSVHYDNPAVRDLLLNIVKQDEELAWALAQLRYDNDLCEQLLDVIERSFAEKVGEGSEKNDGQ